MVPRVVMASPEAIPFAKTGGLADVAGSLPHALKSLGCDLAFFMPYYREVREKGFEVEGEVARVVVGVGSRAVEVEVLALRGSDLPVYFLKRDEYYDRSFLYGTPEGDYFDNLERFVLFSRGVLEASISLGLSPDVIHLHDWQTGLISAYLKYNYRSSFKDTGTIFTVHNIAYQGLFNPSFFELTGLPQEAYSTEGLEYWGKINLLKSGMVFSDIVTTVSEGYSLEIQTPEYGYGLEGVLKQRGSELFGVLNGVDYSVWDPSSDEHIVENYSRNDTSGKAACREDLLKEYALKVKPGTPLVGIISRLADQKGFDILSEAIEDIMKLDIAIVVLGTGEKKYHELFSALSKKYPEKLGVKLAFDNTLAHKIEAGADIFLMPSRYEPCGLNQIYSLRYGTVPVVRATGGLDDTISDYDDDDEPNGFKFKEYSAAELFKKLKRATGVFKDKDAWLSLVKRGMAEDFSWEKSAKRYMELYRQVAKKAKERA